MYTIYKWNYDIYFWKKLEHAVLNTLTEKLYLHVLSLNKSKPIKIFPWQHIKSRLCHGRLMSNGETHIPIRYRVRGSNGSCHASSACAITGCSQAPRLPMRTLLSNLSALNLQPETSTQLSYYKRNSQLWRPSWMECTGNNGDNFVTPAVFSSPGSESSSG